jgi:hypothetical protein
MRDGLFPKDDTVTYEFCAWKADGDQCRYPGTCSSGLLGGGPWYCSFHFSCTSAAYGAEVVNASRDYVHTHPRDRFPEVPEQFRKLTVPQSRARINAQLRHVGKGLRGADWAQKILDRIAAGEKLGLLPERLAREAIAMTSTRQPGEDDEESNVNREISEAR